MRVTLTWYLGILRVVYVSRLIQAARQLISPDVNT